MVRSERTPAIATASPAENEIDDLVKFVPSNPQYVDMSQLIVMICQSIDFATNMLFWPTLLWRKWFRQVLRAFFLCVTIQRACCIVLLTRTLLRQPQSHLDRVAWIHVPRTLLEYLLQIVTNADVERVCFLMILISVDRIRQRVPR